GSGWRKLPAPASSSAQCQNPHKKQPMASITVESGTPRGSIRETTSWTRLKMNRDWLGFWFMLPAAGFLILFLAYPLGLGTWISFTDARIGRPGVFIGVENYEWL